jgi:hypothetical protein
MLECLSFWASGVEFEEHVTSSRGTSTKTSIKVRPSFSKMARAASRSALQEKRGGTHDCQITALAPITYILSMRASFPSKSGFDLI